jgi:hypothetical protein
MEALVVCKTYYSLRLPAQIMVKAFVDTVYKC